MKYSKWVVLGSLLFIVAYTMFMTYNFYINGIEPSVLTPYVYGFFGTEIIVCGGLKTAETLKGKNDNEH